LDTVLIVVALIVVAVVVLGLLAWRPSRGSRRTPEDALESDALRREQERNVTDATYGRDRWNLRR
jgi:hypothetical protein